MEDNVIAFAFQISRMGKSLSRLPVRTKEKMTFNEIGKGDITALESSKKGLKIVSHMDGVYLRLKNRIVKK